MKIKIAVVIASSSLILATNCSNPDSSKQAHETQTEESIRAVPRFDPKKSFQVITATSRTTQSSSNDTTHCSEWRIENPAIKSIISRGEIVNGPDWHHLFDVLPCIIRGDLEQNGASYRYELNGGSWGYIHSADTTFILGFITKEDEKHFLSSPMKSTTEP